MTGPRASTVKIAEQLRKCAAFGCSQKDAAQVFSITAARVSQIAKSFEIKFVHGSIRPPSDRGLRMADMYRGGSTLEQIGQHFKLTRERVRQIISRDFGLSAVDGGQKKSAEVRQARIIARREARYLQKYGMSFSEWQEFMAVVHDLKRAGTPTYRLPSYAFRSQRNAAKHRGIVWNMTLAEWWSVWRDSGKWGQRGRGQGYVMCRHGDVGPYAVGNVFIATAIENCSTRKGRRSTLPTGVTRKRDKFVAHRMSGGTTRYLGSFESPDAAHAAYLAAAPQEARAS
jgi:hypothetical protein